MAIREGKWKCKSCDEINLGRNINCQSCGEPRGDDVQFFLDEDAGEVTDEKLLNMAKSGADWTCEWCETDNRATNTHCKQCGAERGTSPSRKSKDILDKDKNIKTQPPKPSGTTGSGSRKKTAMGIGGIIGLLAIVFGIYFLFFHTHEDTLVLQKGVWERVIEIERLESVTKEDWKEDVPSGAYNIVSLGEQEAGTERIQVGTERKKVGNRDLGNGMFEDIYEDVPVYDEKPIYKMRVRYTVDEWKTRDEIKSTGQIRDGPYWPQPQLNQGERVGNRDEKATLYLIDKDNKEYTYSVKVEELSKYKEKASYIAEINTLGYILNLKEQ